MQIHSLCTNALGSGPWSPLNPLPEALAPSQADVVIVGAGVTGLSAALILGPPPRLAPGSRRIPSHAACSHTRARTGAAF